MHMFAGVAFFGSGIVQENIPDSSWDDVDVAQRGERSLLIVALADAFPTLSQISV